MIRAFRPPDAGVLAPMHTAVFPAQPLSAGAFSGYVASSLEQGGRAWTICAAEPIGYALAVPVPGLPHIVELGGCIAPAHRRQGYGTQLLRRVLADLRPAGVRQVAYPTEEIASTGAQFLQRRGFTIEHEEWLLVREDLGDLPRPDPAFSERVLTFQRTEAIAQFRALYAATFSGLPWDQPYSLQEVRATLEDPRDILFLVPEASPLGFAWLHEETPGLGVIEPLGVLPEYQHRGYGRILLLAALHELARRGATRAQIGAWRTNRPAIQLYRSLGFKHRRTISYLAYDLLPTADH